MRQLSLFAGTGFQPASATGLPSLTEGVAPAERVPRLAESVIPVADSAQTPTYGRLPCHPCASVAPPSFWIARLSEPNRRERYLTERAAGVWG